MTSQDAEHPRGRRAAQSGPARLSYRARATLKKIQLAFWDGQISAQQAFAQIFDALAEDCVAAVGPEALADALREQIASAAFRFAVENGIITAESIPRLTGIITFEDSEQERLRTVDLTLSRLRSLKARYGDPLRVVEMCHLMLLPQLAKELIDRNLSPKQARHQLLDLRAKLEEAFPIRSHHVPSEGTASDLPSLAAPDPLAVKGLELRQPTHSAFAHLKEIFLSSGRQWDDFEARLWLLARELDLEAVIERKALEWEEKGLRWLAEQQAETGIAAGQPGQAKEAAAPLEPLGRPVNSEVLNDLISSQVTESAQGSRHRWEPEQRRRFGRKLRRLRELKGWSIDDLARKLCCSADAISRWEQGRSCPQPDRVPKLAEVLGVSAAELLPD